MATNGSWLYTYDGGIKWHQIDKYGTVRAPRASRVHICSCTHALPAIICYHAHDRPTVYVVVVAAGRLQAGRVARRPGSDRGAHVRVGPHGHVQGQVHGSQHHEGEGHRELGALEAVRP